jgi:ABC-type transport system involved in multi-copper enzyme maturation permease subunit
MKFGSVVATELSKLRRSKVTWISLAVYTFMVAMLGFFMWMMMNPGVAQTLGLLSQKANLTLAGLAADWPAFLTLVGEMGGLGGLIVFSVIVTYVFGREYVEGTAKNMLALPMPRSGFVFAKIIVSVIWFAVLTLWLIVEAYLVGSMLRIPGLTTALFLATVGKLLVLALMALCCGVVVAWIAVESRGYFAPMGFAIFTMVLASVFGHTGWGPWVPWSILGIYSGAAGPFATLEWGSFVVIGATFVIGTALTVRHEVYADNGQ